MAYGDLDTRCLGFEGFTSGVGFDGVPVASQWSLPADGAIQVAVLHRIAVDGSNWWDGYRPRAMKIHVTTVMTYGSEYAKDTNNGNLATFSPSYYDGATEILFDWGAGTYDFRDFNFDVYYEAFDITRIELDPPPVIGPGVGFWVEENKCVEAV